MAARRILVTGAARSTGRRLVAALAADPAVDLVVAVDDDHIHGEVSLIDHFGNIALNVSREELESVGVVIGDRVEVRIGGQTYKLPFEETFGSVPIGRLVLHEDSFGALTVAVNQGRAAARLQARTGDPVVIARVVE